jgi:mono/diheme cytochrome c family protein
MCQFDFLWRRAAPILLVVIALSMAILEAAPAAQESSPGTVPSINEQAVSFSEAYLGDQSNIDAGKVLWQKQCRHCHGKAAYPGKAPKLKPSRYTADLVYDRVTYGFRKMPAWEKVYSQEARMAVVAFVLSDQFSP